MLETLTNQLTCGYLILNKEVITCICWQLCDHSNLESFANLFNYSSYEVSSCG